MSQEPLFTTRRELLGGGLTLLSAAATLPLFLGKTLTALGATQSASRPSRDERILVVVQLAGGNDGLNTIIPVEQDAYYKARRSIAIAAKDALKLEGGVALHPAATGLKELFDAGRMAVVQGVGYPNPNRSHFTSMDIWHTGDPEMRRRGGWIGRYFDSCCTGSDPGPEPIDGVALMGEAPLAMQGEQFMPMAFSTPDSLAWQAGNRDTRAAEAFARLNNRSGDFPKTEGELAAFLQRAALKAQVGAADIRTAAGRSLSGARGRLGRRGGDLGRTLQLVHKMIAAGLPTRIYYVSMGGFDTHSAQLGRHQQLMTQLGEGMRDFIDALEEDKLLDRVLVLTFSEFGRRVQENASGGTDHGEAAPAFLFGSKIRPGVHEKHPDLSRLNRGDLAFGVDFRRLYASVLRDWLKTKPDKIIGSFAPLPVIRTT